MIDVTKSGIHIGDCRELLAALPDGCVQTCVTSPPYWGLRDYGCEGQIGLEPTPEAYVETMVAVFEEVRRALADDGTLWLNLGDCYAQGGRGSVGQKGTLEGAGENHTRSREALEKMPNGRRLPPGLKHKDLVGIPWLVAFALRAAGWYLRADIVWHKPSPMPESVRDRPTKAHEYIFLLSKNERYYYDVDAIREPQASRGERHQGKSGYRESHPSKDTRTANERTLHPLGKNKQTVWTADEIEERQPRYAAGNKERKQRGDYGGNAEHNGRQAFGVPWEDEDGHRNKRSVWTVATQPYDGAHFAVFPPALIEPCILAGSRPGDLVLDPFFGSGTTGQVAEKHERRWIGFDINPAYGKLARERTAQPSLVLERARER